MEYTQEDAKRVVQTECNNIITTLNLGRSYIAHKLGWKTYDKIEHIDMSKTIWKEVHGIKVKSPKRNENRNK